VTKELPFRGETLGALCAALYQTPLRTPRMIRADIPEPVDKVIMRCLSLDPAQRFASVADLARALAPHGSGRAAAAVERAAVMLEPDDPPPSETKPLVIANLAAPTRVEPFTPNLLVPAPATQAGWGTVADPGAAPRRRASVAVPLTLAVIAAGALGAAFLHMRAPHPRAVTATAPAPSAMLDAAAPVATVEASSSQTASAAASVVPSAPPSAVPRPRAPGPRSTASQRPSPTQNLNLEDRH
jgi:eukaryotic-like serine/threonine-protein kinase